MTKLTKPRFHTTLGLRGERKDRANLRAPSDNSVFQPARRDEIPEGFDGPQALNERVPTLGD